MICGFCGLAVDETRERHGTFCVPSALKVVDPAFDAWYKDMQMRYPCMEAQDIGRVLPPTREIPVCLSCCTGLLRAAGLGWEECQSLEREAEKQ